MLITRDTVIVQPQITQKLQLMIAEDLLFFKSKYPEFNIWFEKKVLPGLMTGERTIIVENRDNEVAGFAILKHTNDESKICTLRIRDAYENKGLGIKLFERSFNILETTTPLLSVSDEIYPMYQRIFKYFNFLHEATYYEKYRPRINEFSFNGLL